MRRGGGGEEATNKFAFPSSPVLLPLLPPCAMRSFQSSLSRASRLSPALALLACSVLLAKPWESLWRRQTADVMGKDVTLEKIL